MATRRLHDPILYLRKAGLQSIPDKQLLTDYLCKKDGAALSSLIGRHGPMVWGVCRRILNHHDAEDAFQATFLVFVRRATSIKCPDLLANWLYGVAFQTARKARSRNGNRYLREQSLTETASQSSEVDFELLEVQRLLDEELFQLPHKYQKVIVLCDLSGCTRREVATQLGVPQGTVAGWLVRARKLLAKRLERRGAIVSILGLTSWLSKEAIAYCLPATLSTRTLAVIHRGVLNQYLSSADNLVSVYSLSGGVIKAMSYKFYATACGILLAVTVLAISGAALLNKAYTHDPANEVATNRLVDAHIISHPTGQSAVSKRNSPNEGESKDDKPLVGHQKPDRVKSSGSLFFTTKDRQIIVVALTFEARYEIVADRLTYDESKMKIEAQGEAGKVSITIYPDPLAVGANKPKPKHIQCDRLVFDRGDNSLELTIGNQTIAFELNDAFFNSIRKTAPDSSPEKKK